MPDLMKAGLGGIDKEAQEAGGGCDGRRASDRLLISPSVSAGRQMALAGGVRAVSVRIRALVVGVLSRMRSWLE